jgi:hypothetical protein
LIGLGLVISHYLIFSRFFPNANGTLGVDYSFVLPYLLNGYIWSHVNGIGDVPWFTPAFCGGIPYVANPQNFYYSIPQWLAFLTDPLTSVRITIAGFAAAGFFGFYLLARRCCSLSRATAMLGATLFLFNGFYIHRMIIGHFVYHSFMAVPLLAFLVLRPLPRDSGSRIRHAITDSALGALLVAYMVFSGAAPVMGPFLLAVVLVCGIAALESPSQWSLSLPSVKFGAAVGLGLGLAAAKISATMAFMDHFPRDLYLLPGVPDVISLLGIVLQSLFLFPAHELAAASLVNSQWLLDRHEFEFGVTFIPAALILAGVWTQRHHWLTSAWWCGFTLRQWVIIGGLVCLLMIPLAGNYYTPGWNAFLKQVPVVRNSSSLIRWFCVYIPVAILAGCLALDSFARWQPYRWQIAGLAIAFVVVVNVATDRTFYHQAAYNPDEVVAAYGQVKSGSWAPQITHIAMYGDSNNNPLLPVFRNNTFLKNRSQLLCYEPVFGYRLEHFPFKTLRPGPVADVSGDTLNLKNPACFVFPDENHCAPGDHFRADQLAAATEFVHYRPFSFDVSSGQRRANDISVLSLLVLVGALAGCLWHRFQRAGRSR